MSLSLHGITKARLRRITQLVSEGVTSPRDGRGGHRKERCVSDELKVQISNNVLSFPSRVAHYTKTLRKTRYLSSQLSINKMWTSYLQLYEPKAYLAAKQNNMYIAKPRVKYEFFLRYYKENFNYPFGRLRVDVCATCEKLKVDIQCQKISTIREKLKTELKLHKTKSQKFYALMKESESQKLYASMKESEK